MKKTLKYILISIVAINILGIIFYLFSNPKNLENFEKQQIQEKINDSIKESKDEIETNASADRSTEAFVFSQEIISNKLKSPASAEFPSITDENVRVVRNDKKYTILSFVDSQNSFGAQMRAKYICEMTYLPESNIFKVTKATILE